MQSEVHLVGDVPEVTAAAGGTAVVHMEARDDAVGIDLDRLRVLAADVEHGARGREHRVRAEAVAKNLAADLLLRERQALSPVPCADGSRLDELDGADGLDCVAKPRGMRRAVRQLGQRGRERGREVALEGVTVDDILDDENRAVEDRAEDVERDSLRISPFLGQVHEVALREVTEEIALAGHAFAEVVGGV